MTLQRKKGFIMERVKNFFKNKFDRIEAYWIVVIYAIGVGNAVVFLRDSAKAGFIYLGVALLIGIIMAWKARGRSL